MIPFSVTPDSCAYIAISITAADSDLTSPVRALYVGTPGDVRITTPGGGAVTFKNVQMGTVLPIMVQRVWSTGTTAGDIVGLI